ncbi:MAG: hypothetical protein HC828_10425 [Blastochloris sp.]|nr:hypothetical protein [Blastochloris sp.]
MDSGPLAAASLIRPDQLDATYFWFYRAVDRALQGGNLEQELADAQPFTEAYLACAQEEGADAATCATQADPEYNGFLQPTAEPE